MVLGAMHSAGRPLEVRKLRFSCCCKPAGWDGTIQTIWEELHYSMPLLGVMRASSNNSECRAVIFIDKIDLG